MEDNFSMDGVGGWGDDGSGGNVSDGEHRRSFSPRAHLLLGRPVPNRLRTSTGPGGWGPLT